MTAVTLRPMAPRGRALPSRSEPACPGGFRFLRGPKSGVIA